MLKLYGIIFHLETDVDNEKRSDFRRNEIFVQRRA